MSKTDGDGQPDEEYPLSERDIEEVFDSVGGFNTQLSDFTASEPGQDSPTFSPQFETDSGPVSEPLLDVEVEEWPTVYDLDGKETYDDGRGNADNSGDVYLTYVFGVDVSNRKASEIRNYISEAQTIRRHASHVIRSFEVGQWGRNSSVYSAIKDTYNGRSNVNSENRRDNINKVGEAFKSWEQNGFREAGANPPQYGVKDYIVIEGDKVDVWDNKRGVTVQIGGVDKKTPDPGRSKAFDLPISYGKHQLKVLNAIERGAVSVGRSELHYHDDGGDGRNSGWWTFHLTVKYNQPVYKPQEVDHWIGIDLGMTALYTAAVCTKDPNSENGMDVLAVERGPGLGLKHERKQHKNALRHLQKTRGYAAASEKLGSKLSNHAKQLEHEYANDIISLAEQYEDPGLVFENIKGIGDLGWQHLWAYHRFREVIRYKAHQKGIPSFTLSKAKTRNTSTTCSKCGLCTGGRTWCVDDYTPPEHGRISQGRFVCPDPKCGYESNADANAGIKIAQNQFVEIRKTNVETRKKTYKYKYH